MNADVMHKMRAFAFHSDAWLSIGPAERGRRIVCKVPFPLSRLTRRARWWNLSPDRPRARGPALPGRLCMTGMFMCDTLQMQSNRHILKQ
jgi:hypothetical protein